ncbi:hypothetical protein [Sphingobium mellinum]|uniref:hypothetical protein n=1 Tax=Sphingobium mellinum TaxID=1387166 RepID=UPI0030ECD44B
MTKLPEDASQGDATTPPADTQPDDLATAARKSVGRGVWMGTAVGIGSAAIVAALLYTSKKRG